jgi:hypothetical protein
MDNKINVQPTETANGDRSTADQAHPCPFPRCKRSYSKQRDLKHHLRTIRGGGHDELHPPGHPEWQKLDETGFLKLQTRPKGVSAEEKEKRRAASQSRYYEQHKAEILERARARREKVNDTLKLAKELDPYVQSLEDGRPPIRSNVHVLLRGLYPDSSNLQLDRFVDITAEPTLETFARLVAYYIPLNALPDITHAVPGKTLMLDVVPGYAHYIQVSAALNPEEKPGDLNIHHSLNKAFDLYKPILDDLELAYEPVHADDDESISEFVQRGERYATLSKMYLCYKTAAKDAMEFLLPRKSNLSFHDVQVALERIGQEEKLFTEMCDDGEIGDYLEKPAGPASEGVGPIPRTRSRKAKSRSPLEK